MWQRWWDERGRRFLMLGVAQDAQGAERVRPVVRERGVEFPVLVDRASTLAAALRFQVVPTGVFVDDGEIAYRHPDDFEAGDPRIRLALEAFLSGEPVPPPAREERMRPAALRLWREALEIDPDNFLVRSQIWALEHPERFWPAVDRQWQEEQLMREGYEGALP